MRMNSAQSEASGFRCRFLCALTGFSAKLLTELLNASRGIDKLLLAREKGVGFRARIEFVEWVLFAVGPLHRLFGLDC